MVTKEEKKIKNWMREYYDELEAKGQVKHKIPKEEIVNKAYSRYKLLLAKKRT